MTSAGGGKQYCYQCGRHKEGALLVDTVYGDQVAMKIYQCQDCRKRWASRHSPGQDSPSEHRPGSRARA
ncbi:hypothetical protein ACFWAT_09145 [Streptomyces syringium]|uniref:hypothetical protein n=1 Tax=Streptomyces syringium TaxID=76729 RepID=UPI00365BF844